MSSTWKPRRLLSIPAVRSFLVLSLVLFLFAWYGEHNFYRDPGSIWYDDSRAFERGYSAFRESQAREWLDATKKQVEKQGHSNNFTKADTDAKICATFLTVARPGTDPYLDTTLASALDRLTASERRDVHLSVFFATTKPYEHSSYQTPWIRETLDDIFDYNDILTPEEVQYAKQLEEAKQNSQKAAYDYTLPIRRCLNSTAQYIALLEDDIILAESWMARTLLGLREVEKRQGDNWLFLRLFNQERSTGWASKKIMGNNVPMISFLVGSGLAIFLVIIRLSFKDLSLYLDYWTILITCYAFIPIFVILFIQSGKASVLPPHSGVTEEDFGCCAQALVFNRHHMQGLIGYLYQRQKDGVHDMLTRDFARTQGLARWDQYPVMAQHIGNVSSIQKKVGESAHVWSMAFESLNPRSLSRQHNEMVRQLYGKEAVYSLY